jgi:MFS superfamily sulfate permease-like transporter
MVVHTVKSIVCPACRAEFDVSDHFCRYCGVPASLRYASGDQVALQAARQDPLDSPWVVLGLLFVLGPLAFPFLYRSRAFRWPVKLALAIVVLMIAAVAIWVTLHLIGWIVGTLQEARQPMHRFP